MPQVVVVLGSRHIAGSPGSVLETRLQRTIDLLRTLPADAFVVVSGYQEAEVMAQWLRAHDVDPERIVLEPHATSTNENLENAWALFSGQRLLVVTSDFHRWRTQLWAWHLRIPISISTAHTPSPHRWSMLARECAALPHSVARILWRTLLRSIARPRPGT